MKERSQLTVTIIHNVNQLIISMMISLEDIYTLDY